MPFVCIGSLVLLVAWLIIAIVCQNTAIRPREITEYEITLTGACEAFIDAVDEARADRRARKRERARHRDDEDDDELRRRRPRDDDEDDDEPRPRGRRKPPSDAIEE